MVTLDVKTTFPHMTFDGFLAWSNERTHAEWVDGKVDASIDAEGRFWSDAAPGFWMMVRWFWEKPTLAEVLAAWESGPTREEGLRSRT